MKIKNLSVNEQKFRNLYLRKLALGEIQGPPTGYASIDNPWLSKYPEVLLQMPRKKYNKVVDLLKEVWFDSNDILINYYDEEISSGLFFQNVEKTAKALKSLGYKKGDCIPVALESTPEFLYLLLGAELIGVSVRNKLDDIDQIIHCINSTNSKYFLTYDYLSKEDSDLIYQNTNIEKIVTISPVESFKDKNRLNLLRDNVKNTILEKYTKEITDDVRNISWGQFLNYGLCYQGSVYERSDENTELFSAYTSGSTGLPKGLAHSSKSFLGIIQQMALFPSHDKDKKRDTWLLPILPPTLVAVVVAMMCYPLADGKKLILDPYCKVEDLDLEIMHYEPSCCGFGPYFFSYLVYSNRIPEDYDMSYMKLIGFGAEPMIKSFINDTSIFLEKHNCKAPLSSGYGQSEGGSDFTVALGKETLLSGSSGIPLIDTTIAIFEKGTVKELGYQQIGEICKTGPGIMLGYHDKELTSQVLKVHEDGKLWLHTGDYGYMTNEGVLFVLGREVIQLNENQQVFPLPIENKISDLEDIHDAIVVVGDNPEDSKYQVPYLFVVPMDKTTKDKLKVSIQSRLEQILTEEEMPYEVYVIDKKPISKGLKTDKKWLQEQYNLKRKVLKK